MLNLSLLAQAPAPAGGGFGQFLPLIIIFIMMWVILIRPQQKARKELAAKVAAMKIGDKAITSGGIHGLVHKIKDRTVTLKVAEGTMLEFEKSAIQSVAGKGDKSTPAPAKAKADEAKVIEPDEVKK